MCVATRRVAAGGYAFVAVQFAEAIPDVKDYSDREEAVHERKFLTGA